MTTTNTTVRTGGLLAGCLGAVLTMLLLAVAITVTSLANRQQAGVVVATQSEPQAWPVAAPIARDPASAVASTPVSAAAAPAPEERDATAPSRRASAKPKPGLRHPGAAEPRKKSADELGNRAAPAPPEPESPKPKPAAGAGSPSPSSAAEKPRTAR